MGGFLRKRRLELGIEQSAAAKILGVQTNALSRWERDTHYPLWRYHASIIKYLGFDPFPELGLKDPYCTKTRGIVPAEEGSVGAQIRRRRLELKLTNRECAKAFGVEPSAMSNWQSGEHIPAARFWPRIIEFLGRVPFPHDGTPGGQLAHLRRCLGLTQIQAAELIGVPPLLIIQFEANREQPDSRFEMLLKKLKERGRGR